MKSALLVSALSCLLAAAATAQTPATTHKPANPATHTSGTAHHAPAGRASLLKPATLNATAPAQFNVRFTTTVGDFVVQVHRDWAPLGADRFYNLVKNGFYNNAAFFRVVPRFVVQFGLNANPAISKAWQEAKIQDDPVKQSNKRGMVVFAMAGPNTRTTQLFVNTVDNARLDGMGFAPFGEVTEGMDTLDKIFPAYGQRPDQEQILAEGDAYLKKNFPEMDRIKTARVETAAASVPAKRPAGKTGK